MPQPRQHLAHREEVAQRLRHLLVIDVDEAVVYPDVRELVAVGSARLGDLILVMRKLQIHAATMDVEMGTQNGGGHG